MLFLKYFAALILFHSLHKFCPKRYATSLIMLISYFGLVMSYWCLTPLSTIFHFIFWCSLILVSKEEYTEENANFLFLFSQKNMSIVSLCCNLSSWMSFKHRKCGYNLKNRFLLLVAAPILDGWTELLLILVIKEHFIKAWSKLVILANGRRLKCEKPDSKSSPRNEGMNP